MLFKHVVFRCSHDKGGDSPLKYLPESRPLTDTKLRTDLDAMIENLVGQTDDLSNLGSSQANESLNMTIASKAPKSK